MRKLQVLVFGLIMLRIISCSPLSASPETTNSLFLTLEIMQDESKSLEGKASESTILSLAADAFAGVLMVYLEPCAATIVIGPEGPPICGFVVGLAFFGGAIYTSFHIEELYDLDEFDAAKVIFRDASKWTWPGTDGMKDELYVWVTVDDDVVTVDVEGVMTEMSIDEYNDLIAPYLKGKLCKSPAL